MVPMNLGVGSVVWWSLPNKIGTRRLYWNSEHPDFPLSDEPAGDVLRRACYSLEAPQGTKRLVRPLKSRGEWAVVIETPDSTTDLDYRVEFTVRAEKDRLVWVRYPTTTAGNGLMARLDEAYQTELETISPGQVADLILNYIRGTCLACQTRKTGGVYFVPAGMAAQLDKVDELISQLGGRLCRMEIADDQRSREDALEFVIGDLHTAVDNVKAFFASRHRNDALSEAGRALDRVRFYGQALGLAEQEATRITAEIEEAIKENLKQPKKKGVKA